MLSRFHTIPACYGRTDGRTDRITMSIPRVSSSMLTRDKNTDTMSKTINKNKMQSRFIPKVLVIYLQADLFDRFYMLGAVSPFEDFGW